ncbi:MAG: hypothetical protein H7343_24120 [Undibacterium sp.]|nr:hypothetical protein [Opitutaceae bacterium]
MKIHRRPHLSIVLLLSVFAFPIFAQPTTPVTPVVPAPDGETTLKLDAFVGLARACAPGEPSK